MYSGTGSVAEIFADKGYEVVTVDIDPKYQPSIQVDMLEWDYKSLFKPGYFSVITCSPPCTEFSRAMTSRPRDLEYADSLVLKGLEIIHYLQPDFWYVENPQTGLLKSRPYMKGYAYVDVDYCCFSDWGYKKRTRFWGPEILGFQRNILCDLRTCPNLQLHVDGVWGHNERLGRSPTAGQRKLLGKEQYGIPRGVIEYIMGWNPHAAFMASGLFKPTFTQDSVKPRKKASSRKVCQSGNACNPPENLYEREVPPVDLPPDAPKQVPPPAGFIPPMRDECRTMSAFSCTTCRPHLQNGQKPSLGTATQSEKSSVRALASQRLDCSTNPTRHSELAQIGSKRNAQDPNLSLLVSNELDCVPNVRTNLHKSQPTWINNPRHSYPAHDSNLNCSLTAGRSVHANQLGSGAHRSRLTECPKPSRQDPIASGSRADTPLLGHKGQGVRNMQPRPACLATSSSNSKMAYAQWTETGKVKTIPASQTGTTLAPALVICTLTDNQSPTVGGHTHDNSHFSSTDSSFAAIMHEQNPAPEEVYPVDFPSGNLTMEQASALEKFTSAQLGLPCGYTMATSSKSGTLQVAAASASQSSPPDHDKYQRLVNYVKCLRFDCPTHARVNPILDDETIETIAHRLYNQEKDIRFIKGAVDARDPMDTKDVDQRRERLHQEFKDTVFSGKVTGSPPIRGPFGEAFIKLKPGATPIKHRPFNITGERRTAWIRLTDEILKDGKIEPGMGPWNSASFPVPKKKPGEYRLVEDFRDVNSATEDDAHPLPRIDMILQKQGTYKIWSTLDMKDGYHQMPMRKEDRYITCMSTPRGTMQWRVLVMGLKNGNAMFQRMMEWVLEKHTNADPYVDDVIIGSTGNTEEELLDNHERDVREVLQTLAEQSLYADWDKAKLFMREVEFCGHVLREGKRGPAPGKLLSIQGWELPKTVTQLRGFLGLTNYYSCYVPNYADLAAPLMAKLQLNREDGKKGSQKPIRWTTPDVEAFVKLKHALTEQLELFQLDPDQPFVMRTDASDTAIGAVLEQEREGKWVPVAFFSRKLGGSQLNWTPREKETYAIVSSLRKWAGWIGFQPVLIRTDHRSLEDWVGEHVDTPSGPRGRRARWHETLSQFNLEVQYLPGKDNIVADAMSRYAYPASSAREDVSFHGSADAKEEMRKIIEKELREGRMVGLIHLGGRYLDAKRRSQGSLVISHGENTPTPLASHVRVINSHTLTGDDSSAGSSTTPQPPPTTTDLALDSPGEVQSKGATPNPSLPIFTTVCESADSILDEKKVGILADQVLPEKETCASTSLCPIEGNSDDPIVSPNTTKMLGVSREEWAKIAQEGLQSQMDAQGRHRITFSVYPDPEAEVILQLNTAKCINEEIIIRESPDGYYYTEGVGEQCFIPPAYILRAVDAEHGIGLEHDGSGATSSNADLGGKPRLQFEFKHKLPELMRGRVKPAPKPPPKPDKKQAKGKGRKAPLSQTRKDSSSSSEGDSQEPSSSSSEKESSDEDYQPSDPPESVPDPPPIIHPVLEQDWTQAYLDDPFWSDPWKKTQDASLEWPEGYRISSSIGTMKLLRDGRICVPQSKAKSVMAALHASTGHLGVDRTIVEWKRRYNATPTQCVRKLAKGVKLVCPTCQKSEPPNWEQIGPMSANPVPARIFDSVCIDVFSMPPVNWQDCEYDCMILCVDRLSGWIIARPYTKEGLTAEKTAHLLLDYGWNEMGIPSTITSDQGPQFTGQWWRTLCARLGIRHAYSQAHRPQGNGRAEVAGRQIITMLRKMNDHPHFNWVEALPRALAKHHDAIGPHGVSPHQIVFGRHRNLPGISYTPLREAQEAKDFLSHQEKLDEYVADEMNKLHAKQMEALNSRRRSARGFEVDDKVWLMRPKEVGGHKIESWWTGPFRIRRKLGQNVYEVQISAQETKEVHADQIKLYHHDVEDSDGIPLFYDHTDPPHRPPMEVERIRDHRTTPQGLEFLVHWKGTPNTRDSWEPPTSFIALHSPVWLDYCIQNRIFDGLQGLPVECGIYPRLTPWEEPLL